MNILKYRVMALEKRIDNLKDALDAQVKFNAGLIDVVKKLTKTVEDLTVELYTLKESKNIK